MVIFIVEEDMKGDSIKDRVVIYGRDIVEEISPGGEKKNKYIVIIDGKNQKVLTSIDCAVVYTEPLITIKINTIVDLNDDGIKEIVVDSHTGGSAGGESYLLEYKNGTYVAATFEEVKIEHRLIDGFKVEFIEKNSGKTYTTNLTEDQRSRYIKAKAYTKDGKYITNYSHHIGTGNIFMRSQVIDVDNDGKLEYIKQKYLIGDCNADSVTNLVEIYEYRDGKYVLKDYLAQAGEYSYNKDFKEPEAFKMKDNTSTNNSGDYSASEVLGVVNIENLEVFEKYIPSDNWELSRIENTIVSYFPKYFSSKVYVYIDERSIKVDGDFVEFSIYDVHTKKLLSELKAKYRTSDDLDISIPLSISNLGALRKYFNGYSDQKVLHHTYEPINNIISKEFSKVRKCNIDGDSISVKDNTISFTVTDYNNNNPLKAFTLSLTID